VQGVAPIVVVGGPEDYIPFTLHGTKPLLTLELPGGLNQSVSFTLEGRVPLITRKAILSDL
jgi:hypothetical protein